METIGDTTMNDVLIESILGSVKKQVNVAPECTSFDEDLVMYINAQLAILNDIGVGTDGFTISDGTSTWADFIPDNVALANLARTYTGTKVKIIFDPPTSSIVLEASKNYATELEWRMSEKVKLLQEE